MERLLDNMQLCIVEKDECMDTPCKKMHGHILRLACESIVLVHVSFAVVQQLQSTDT